MGNGADNSFPNRHYCRVIGSRRARCHGHSPRYCAHSLALQYEQRSRRIPS
jgi:hypothetical protein